MTDTFVLDRRGIDSDGLQWVKGISDPHQHWNSLELVLLVYSDTEVNQYDYPFHQDNWSSV